jgi:hypothetical protein
MLSLHIYICVYIYMYICIYYASVCNLVGWMVGDICCWDSGPYGTIFMNVCYYNRCHGNGVKGFWAYGMIFMTMCVL